MRLDRPHHEAIRDHDDWLPGGVHDGEFLIFVADRSSRMFEQSLQNYEAPGTGHTERAMATEEDGFLVAAKRGDSAAFEMLCKQSASTVLHIARRMMRTKEDAEDVMQESFQLAFIHLKSFKGGLRFSTWLSRIAINAYLMKLRRKSQSRDVSLYDYPPTQET